MFSNVWSENTALFERLMEIHSNSPKLYYGFKEYIKAYQCPNMINFDSVNFSEGRSEEAISIF